MKRNYAIVLVFGVVVLFFIQLAGTLVESIYVLDLMNLNLDEKALGLLFFFMPLLLIPFYKKYPRGLMWASFVLLLSARGLLPYLNTSNRMLASGLGTFAALSLFFLLLASKARDEARSRPGLWESAGLALALSLSIMLRSVYYGLDYSLTPAGGWAAWGMGLALSWGLTQVESGSETPDVEKKKGGVTFGLLGLYLILTLAWFAFSAPAVIARWTAGSYPMIVIVTSLLSIGWILLALLRPAWIEWIGQRGLLLWNILFTISLSATLLAQRVSFPPTIDSAPVVVTASGWLPQALLVSMLMLFPVIFFDMRVFTNQIRQAEPSARELVPGILLGSFVLLLLVFANIFSNVWGYIEPVSTPFRNTFWLTYFLMTGMISLLAWRAQKPEPAPEEEVSGSFDWGWAVLLAGIFSLTVVWALPGPRIQVDASQRSSLVAMTFNIQQANDGLGEKSYDRQLALIRRVSPDILALQESDSTRIALNNNDYVRYFAESLGYYSYYGPTTITGTFGTAILSKAPFLNTRAVFIYSDTDEIGVAEAEIEVGGHRFTIYDVHPDGSEAVKLGFAKALLERSKDKPDVIALGDYNLQDTTEAYKLINGFSANAWASVYPSKISTDGVDMSGDNRIDHIFMSPDLHARNPIYVLPPESASDHPVHWAEIYWDQP